MSNFDISGKGGLAYFKEYAVKQQDYKKIYRVTILFGVTKKTNEG